MAGTEQIQEKILERYRVQADQIIKKANQRAAEIIEEAKKEERAAQEAFDKKTELECAALRQRLLSAAHAEGKKQVLTKKQEMLDMAFSKALEHLCSLPDEDYGAVLAGMVAAKAAGNEELILSAKDQKRLSGKFVREVNHMAAKEGRKLNITLSKQFLPDDLCGFVLKDGDIEQNCTFEAIFHEKRDTLEADVVGLLFGKGKID